MSEHGPAIQQDAHGVVCMSFTQQRVCRLAMYFKAFLECSRDICDLIAEQVSALKGKEASPDLACEGMRNGALGNHSA